jgi:hypothetical protein
VRFRKAKARLLGGVEAAPIEKRFLQQRERPDDIGLDEIRRTVDRAVHVASAARFIT